MIDKANIEKTNAWPFVEAKRILKHRKKNIDQKGKIILQTGYGPSIWVSNLLQQSPVSSQVVRLASLLMLPVAFTPDTQSIIFALSGLIRKIP